MIFQDKTVVITGAGSGIGRALALAFTKENAQVVLSDWKAENLKETQQLCQDLGKKGAEIYVLDVSKREAVFEFADAVLKKFQKVDILINNAGVSLGGTFFDTIPQSDFEWVMNINFWGVVYGTQAFMPHLKTRPIAWIVNISSIFGITAMQMNVPYSASKFAVRGFTEALRMELLHFPNVIPVSVHPGGIKTNIVRYGKHKDEKSADYSAKDFEKMAKTTPEEAASVILKGIAKQKRKILIGNDAKVMNFLAWLFPVKYSNIIKRIMDRGAKKS
jgi:NAD(P)-dependent dehydrogenase (short-subunit alcohol dehydrogenase family)